MSRTSESCSDALAVIPELQDCRYYTRNNVFHIGKYSVQRHLATGGEADVFLCCDTVTNSQVAILNIKNLAEAEDRIQIHRRVNNISGVVRLLEIIRINKPRYRDVSEGHMADIIKKRSIFLVTNYVAGKDCLTFMK